MRKVIGIMLLMMVFTAIFVSTIAVHGLFVAALSWAVAAVLAAMVVIGINLISR